MPHATNVPSSGFQAVILCGPGVSLNTFTSKPDDFPKALVPIANRPMVWYSLDWCYRMGVTKILLVTPPSSEKALEAALSQNPHLTALPPPRADIVAPKLLTHTTGTAALMRLPEVQSAIVGDFIILPCDLVCELPGEALLESWMVQQTSPGSQRGVAADTRHQSQVASTGGLGVWFETRAADHVKGAETDFIITASAPPPVVPDPPSSLRPHISRLLYATTTDTLRDIMQEKGGLPVRSSMLSTYGKIRMLTTHRDAHIYVFPHWVLGMIARNEKFDSISEDVLGWWAKATWQTGLPNKLQMPTSHAGTALMSAKEAQSGIAEMDLLRLTSTKASSLGKIDEQLQQDRKPPPIQSYLHPQSSDRLIRRVDTSSLLLSTSIRLAALPPVLDPGVDNEPTPLSHTSKISTDPSLIAPRTTIHTATTLIAPNTSIAQFCTIKNSCIGANCVIAEGVKITDSILMDGVQIESKASLQGCILGRRCIVGKGSRLDGCEVQESFRVEDGTAGSKGEKFCVFEGLESGLDDPESPE